MCRHHWIIGVLSCHAARSMTAFTSGDAALGIDKLWVNADGKIMLVSADDIDTVAGGNTFLSMAGGVEAFVGSGIDVTSDTLSIGLAEGASIRGSTAEIEGTDSVTLSSMGASVKISRDAGSQFTSMQVRWAAARTVPTC